MKYRLKRDLPFAEAGAIVTIEGERPIEWDGMYRCDYLSTEDLIREGWIEEVKPREWIIERIYDVEYLRPYDAKGKLHSKDSEIIKVREVI